MTESTGNIPHLALYARVSTIGQVEGTSLDDQVQRTKARAQADGHEHLVEYVDGGESGADSSRPALTRLLDAARRGDITTVYATKLDRLARSLRNLLDLIDTLDKHDVGLVVLDEAYDSDSHSGRMVTQILGAVAEYERNLIRERGERGKIAAIEANQWPGGRPPYGYRLYYEDDKANVVINETEAEVVRTIYRMLVVDGKRMVDIADKLNAASTLPRHAERWHYKQIGRLLASASPGWSGRWPWRRERKIYDNDGSDVLYVDIPAILTAEQHAALNAVREMLSTRTDGTERTYPLAGKLTSMHGEAMHGYGARGIRKYRCAWAITATRPHGEDKCDCNTIYAETAEQAVWDAVAGLLTDVDALEQLAADQHHRSNTTTRRHEDTVESLRRRVEQAEQQLADAYREAIQGGMNPRTATVATTVYADQVDEAQELLDDAVVMRRAGLRASASATQLRRAAQAAADLVADPDTETVERVYDALDIAVQVTGYDECEKCGGSRRRGVPGRKGPAACDGPCHGTGYLPRLHVSGTVPEMLAGNDATVVELAPGASGAFEMSA